MNNRKKIIAICGSTRATSSNLNLIIAIGDLLKDEVVITLFDQLTEIPHFNPDLDNENPPQAIRQFRQLLRAADGILICTPEYAMGVPGSLKNAIDWTVSSCEFSKKPVALITASSLGHKGHASLMETLKIIEANIPDSSQVVISYIKTKLKGETISDPQTVTQVTDVMKSLLNEIERPLNR